MIAQVAAVSSAGATLGKALVAGQRTEATIVKALAGRRDAGDVTLALIRLAVTERVVETGGKYALAAGEAD